MVIIFVQDVGLSKKIIVWENAFSDTKLTMMMNLFHSLAHDRRRVLYVYLAR